MTQQLRNEFKKLNYTTSYIPGGCTGFVQVLDVSLNKPLKALVAQATADHTDKYHERYTAGNFTVWDRRVLLTKWVAQAWKELHEKYKNTIIETFQRVGLSLNPDGSEDHKIKIKGLDDIKVGDFTRRTLDPETGFGSLTAVDIALVEAVQAIARKKVAKQDIEESSSGEEDKGDKDEREEVFTLGRMNTRSQTQVNLYYTAEEVASLDVNIDDIEAAEVSGL
jgi:hypothetical protein